MAVGYGFMLGLQASGMVTDYLAKQDQERMSKMGTDLDEAGIDNNISATRLATEDQSLQSLKQLRQNLGSQAAIYAARGVSGPMTAISANESVGNQSADERMRRMNEASSIASLKSQKLISTLHQTAYKSQLGSEFTKSVLQNTPTSPGSWSEIGKGFSSDKNYGFGL